MFEIWDKIKQKDLTWSILFEACSYTKSERYSLEQFASEGSSALWQDKPLTTKMCQRTL